MATHSQHTHGPQHKLAHSQTVKEEEEEEVPTRRAEGVVERNFVLKKNDVEEGTGPIMVARRGIGRDGSTDQSTTTTITTISVIREGWWCSVVTKGGIRLTTRDIQ